MFRPPLHSQRHEFVIDFVRRNKPKKVVDLGCAECCLLKKLKFRREIELLVGVDINGAKVKRRMHGLAPIATNYLQPSFDQLRIELYQGSVTQRDVRLREFDLVTGIELIEHLAPPDVDRFSEVVFGYMTPVVVIISTPNSEFNPLLPGLVGFRHSDHKFEWTRAEFQSWALKVCLEYRYEVEFTGVGQEPADQQEGVGFCSQIGVFQRLRGRDRCRTLFGDEDEDVFSYTLLYSVDYPSLHDNNILRRVLVSEVLYWAEKLKRSWMEKAGDMDGPSTLCQTEGGAGGAEECFRASELCKEMEEKRNGMKNLVGLLNEELRWTNGQGPQESRKLRRSVSVPLAVLWSCSPKFRALSGSLSNLRHFLMEEPEVKISRDGSAVLLQDRDLEDEDNDGCDLEDSGCAESSLNSPCAELEQNWDQNV